MHDLLSASATALARAIRRKQISSEEATAACLRRIDQVNPYLNAVVQVVADAALRDAREADGRLARGEGKGALDGVPVTIKDSFEMAGVISTSGTRGRAGFVPERDATAVARLRAAGAVVLGKTNVPDMLFAFETDNLIYGRTNNPYDTERTAGGSSGGEAAIIAAGGSPLGLASDSGGSIRWPAHCCGIAGLKPTSGRCARTGHFSPPGGILDSMWQIGPMARYVEDLKLMLPILAGPDGRDIHIYPVPLGDSDAVALPGLRLAFHTDNGVLAAAPEIAATIRAAAAALAEAGVKVEEDRPTATRQTYDLAMAWFGFDGGASLRALLAMIGSTEIHPLLARYLEAIGGRSPSASDFAALAGRLDIFRRSMLGFLERYDAILCPAGAYTAMRHGTTFDQLRAFSYTMAFNLTGWPAVVVRCGTSPEGLPIGVQIAARPWREDIALALAQHLETAMGGYAAPDFRTILGTHDSKYIA
jgi:amidase